ncbi:MAG: hypothetical protein IPL45_06010 [Actinomycetales bacterium]|nr:hypothetical protein [Actinomycetales bacterium]
MAKRRAASVAGAAALAALLGVLSGCTTGHVDAWVDIGPPMTGTAGSDGSAGSAGAVVTLSAAGDRLVAGLTSGDPTLVPAAMVWSDGAWRGLPVRPLTPYAREGAWQSIAAGPDGSLVAVAGARGGAHANVRWTVWRGTLAEGLTEQEQPFSTFGGWGAGELVGAVASPAGPVLIGSWQSARTGLDIAAWHPDGQRWVRQSSAGTALESIPTAMVGARGVTSWGERLLVAGSVLRLGDGSARQTPAVWLSTMSPAGWARVDLPSEGSAAEAVSAACTAERCAIAGLVDGRLAVWRLDADGARLLAGVPEVAVEATDALPAALSHDGRAILLATDNSDGTATVLIEQPDGWSREPGPRGEVVAFAVVADSLYAVCRQADTRQVVWRRPL